MKFVSWNVNGLRAAIKGVRFLMKLMLISLLFKKQMQKEQKEFDFLDIMNIGIVLIKGYSGTLVYTKRNP